MLTQSATAALLFGAGDIIAQQAIEHQGKNHDVRHFRPDLGELDASDQLLSSCGRLD